MSESIQPLHDRVILEIIPVESQTASGIIIPDTAKEKPQRGRVLYCGSFSKIAEVFKELIGYLEGQPEPVISGIMKYKESIYKLEVKEGDNVLYSKHAGQPIEVDGKSCLIMREGDIMAII